jgi:hypothetical protein
MREQLAKGQAWLAEIFARSKLASRLLSLKSMKRDAESTQAAIQAIKAARAATDAATEAVNAAAAALHAVHTAGNSSPMIVGAPTWNASNLVVPECPSHGSRRLRRIRGGISLR